MFFFTFFFLLLLLLLISLYLTHSQEQNILYIFCIKNIVSIMPIINILYLYKKEDRSVVSCQKNALSFRYIFHENYYTTHLILEFYSLYKIMLISRVSFSTLFHNVSIWDYETHQTLFSRLLKNQFLEWITIAYFSGSTHIFLWCKRAYYKKMQFLGLSRHSTTIFIVFFKRIWSY